MKVNSRYIQITGTKYIFKWSGTQVNRYLYADLPSEMSVFVHDVAAAQAGEKRE